MATIPKNPDTYLFQKTLNQCVQNNYLTVEEINEAIRSEGISNEMLQNIKAGLIEDLGTGESYEFAFERISQSIIHPDHLDKI